MLLMMEVETLGEKIRRLRSERGWSLAELGRRAGMKSVDGLWKIEQGKVKNPYSLAAIAKALEVSVLDLRADTAEVTATNGESVLEGTFHLQGRPADPPAGISPTILMEPPRWDLDIRASAWADIPMCRLDYDDPRQRAIVNTNRFRLRILGTCMEPYFHDGQTVEFEIVRVDRDGLVIGECYAVCRTDGLATFKQLIAKDDDAITLAALNRKEFPTPIVVPLQEIGRIARADERTEKVPKIPVPKIKK